MNELDYAKDLEKQYLKAKQVFSNASVVVNLTELQEVDNLNFDKLKNESKKLGYKLELAKDLNSYWKKQWQIFPQAVFFNENDDL